jgi:hypothetical protein
MRFQVLIAGAFALGAGNAFAHGPQLQITNDGNQITTRALFVDGPYDTTLSSQTSVYVMPLAPVSSFGGTAYWAEPAGPAFAVSGPGLAWCYAWTYTDATTYTTTFPVGSNFVESAIGGLQKHNGSTFVAAPNGAQVQLFRATTNTGVTGSGDSTVELKAIAAPTSAGFDDHQGVKFQLLGDGIVPSASQVPAPVDDGIYLIQLKLSLASQPPTSSIADSDPFHFVFFKGVEPSAALSAAQSAFPGASIQLVPEPGSIGLLMIGSMLACRRNRAARRDQ